MLLPLRRRELVTAIGTPRVTGGDDRQALRALFGRRGTVAAGPLLDADRIHRAVAHDVAAEVEHQAIRLAGMEPKPAAHHLVIQPRRHRGPQQHDAVDVWCVEARGQHVDVAQKPQLTAAEAVQHGVALARRRFAGDESALNPVPLAQRPHDVLTVLDPAGEDQHGLPIGRMTHRLAASRCDQAVVVHQALDLVGHELAGADMQPFKVGRVDAGLADERRQIALDDQLANADLVADMVQEMVRRA